MSPPPHAAIYAIPYINGANSTAVLSEELDGNQAWFTSIKGTTSADTIVIQAPCAGLLSFTDPNTIVIDASAFAALRSIYSTSLTDPLIAKFQITGLNFNFSSTENYFNPASYLNASNAGKDAEADAQNLWTRLTTAPFNQPVSIMPGEVLGIVDTTQPNGTTIYCFLADGSNVPLSWAYAKLLFGQNPLVTSDPNLATWPVNAAGTLYMDMQMQAANASTYAFPNTLSESTGTLTLVYSDASGQEVTVAPQAGIPLAVTSQRAVFSVPTAATAASATPYVNLEVGGEFVQMWSSQQQGPASQNCSITIMPSGNSQVGQKLSNTIMLTTTCLSGSSMLNVTTPAANPAIMQVGTAVFSGNASSTVTGVSIDGTPQNAEGQFADLGGGQWEIRLPVAAGNHTYQFTSADGGTSDLLTVTGVDISVQGNAAQFTPPDTLYLPITQNQNNGTLVMDSLVLNAAITGIEAFGSPVDVEWQLTVQSALPIRASGQRPDATGPAYWIGFSAFVTDRPPSSIQNWNPPSLQLDIDSVEGDIGDSNQTQIAAEYKDADVKSIGLTGTWVSSVNSQPSQAGPIVGTANLGANIMQDGATIAVLNFNEFFITGNDLRSLNFQYFIQYLTQIVDTIFGITGNTMFLGLTDSQLATLILAIFESESFVEQFIGFVGPPPSPISPPAPAVAQETKPGHGVKIGPPAGLGVGQIDLAGTEECWPGAPQPPPQGPLQGGNPWQSMLAISFDWQSSLQQAVRTLYDKYQWCSGANYANLLSWADKAETKRLLRLNPNVRAPTEEELTDFNALLTGNNAYILRCCVKLYNGGARLWVQGGNPAWQSACPYESTLSWDPIHLCWVPPPGQNVANIVEDPVHTATVAQPIPKHYPTTNGLAYDEPYTARVYYNYNRYIGQASMDWGSVD